MNILGTTPLLKTKFLNLMSSQYKDRLGKIKEWVWAQRPNNTSAVMVVPIVVTPEGPKVCVIKEFRVPINDFEIGFPAGLVNPGEDITEAARRELKEETGLDLVKVVKSSPPVFNSAGLTDESVTILIVQASGVISKEGLEDSEQIEASLLSFEQVRNLLDDPTKKIGAKAWIIFYMICEVDKLQSSLKQLLKK